jgi:hypothetical protein
VYPIVPYQLYNPFFEGGYTHPITTVPEYSTAPGWIPWAAEQPPCLPGFLFPCKAGLTDGVARSPIRVCPDNCQRPDGQCYAAYDCYWQRPEFTAKYFNDYTTPKRVYEGQYSQWYFGRGRQFEGGVYQRTFVGAGSEVTFTIKASAWMCQGSPDCKLGHMNPARQAELMKAWGLTGGYYPYRLWTASDIPGFLRGDLPRYDPHDIYTPTMHMKVGIDPTGTFDGSFTGGVYHYPDLSKIVWGKEHDYFDTWGTLVVTTVAKSDYIVVVTSAQSEWPYAYVNNDAGLDAATLDVKKFVWPYEIDLPLVMSP